MILIQFWYLLIFNIPDHFNHYFSVREGHSIQTDSPRFCVDMVERPSFKYFYLIGYWAPNMVDKYKISSYLLAL